MKRQYIQPDTHKQSIRHNGMICVGSIHSEEGLQYGGGSDGSSEEQKPF